MQDIFKQMISLVSGLVLLPSVVFPSPTPLPSPTPQPTQTPTVRTGRDLSLLPTPTETPKPTRIPTPSPTPLIVTSKELDEWFSKYSKEYSVDRQRLWNIAVCESELRPQAKNGDYGGIYQFSTNTWRSTRAQMNLSTDPSLRFHPEEAIKTAAFLLSTRGHSPWPNCSQ